MLVPSISHSSVPSIFIPSHRHTVEPLSVFAARHDETADAVPFVVCAPEVLPVARLPHEPLIQVVVSQCLGHLRDAPVVEGIFHCPCAGAVDAIGHVAQRVVRHQSAAPLLFLVAAWRHVSVFEHQLQCCLIVDALQPLRQGVGHHHLRMTAPLRPSVAVAAPRVWHVAVVQANIDERLHNVALAVRVYQRDQRQRCPIGVPQRIEVIVVRHRFPLLTFLCSKFISLSSLLSPLSSNLIPQRIFPSAVRGHEHSVVEGRVEHTFLLLIAIYHDASQQVVPLLSCLCQLFVERALGDIPLGLQRTDE